MMELTPVGQAIMALIAADREVTTSPRVIEHLCAELELALRALIKKEMVISNLIAVRNPID